MSRLARQGNQRGGSLLLALLLLALLSTLVTHVLQANQWQRRIATHEIAGARAEASAQSAVRWAEQWLMHLPGDQPPVCLEPCDPELARLGTYPDSLAGLEPVLQLNEDWWLTHAHADGFDPSTKQRRAARGTGATPIGRWTVIPLEQPAKSPAAANPPDIRYYRVLARAVPAGRGQAVLIETIVARPWGDLRWQDRLPADGATFCARPDAPRPCGRLRWQQRP